MNSRKCGFFNFRLFDGLSDEIQTNRIIRVDGERIAGIHDLSDKENFPEYEWIDLNGFTLMPGLIDAHMHITLPFVFNVNFKVVLQLNQQLTKNFYNCIKWGVTTIRDMGAIPGKMNQWRRKVESGSIPGPRPRIGSSASHSSPRGRADPRHGH